MAHLSLEIWGIYGPFLSSTELNYLVLKHDKLTQSKTLWFLSSTKYWKFSFLSCLCYCRNHGDTPLCNRLSLSSVWSCYQLPPTTQIKTDQHPHQLTLHPNWPSGSGPTVTILITQTFQVNTLWQNPHAVVNQGIAQQITVDVCNCQAPSVDFATLNSKISQ